MSTLVTRAGKGSPLTHNEVDANFTNLNTDKVEKTSAAITGGTIDGTTVGATTPAAGTFTTLGVTTSINASSGSANADLNVNSKGTGVIKFSNGGGEAFRTLDAGTTSGSAYWTIQGSSGGFPFISVDGTNPNSNAVIASKGSGSVRFYTGGTSGVEQARVSHTASAVNYVQVTGGATTKAVIQSSQGSDSNISFVTQTKGTGAIDLAAGSSGVNISNGGTVTALTQTASGGLYTSIPSVAISVPTTAGGTQATASVNMQLANTPTVTSGGTGYTNGDVLTIVGGTFSAVAQLTVTAVSGGVITSATISAFGTYTVLPSSPVSVTGGTGSSATFTVTWGVRSLTITAAGSGYVEQPTVTFSGGGGSSAAAYATVGSGTVIKTIGTALDIFTANGGRAFQFYDSGGANTGFWSAQAGGSAPFLFAQGSANTTGRLTSSGTGSIAIYTNGGSQLQFQATHTASAVNYVQVTGAATAGLPQISAQGSDTNINILYTTKGTGEHRFSTAASTSAIQFRVRHINSAANYCAVIGAPAGSTPEYQTLGTDTNIDLAFTPKGTGKVRFGTFTADMALVVQGYIEIKDSGGTVRKLAVIA